jgi:hypothetical protein
MESLAALAVRIGLLDLTSGPSGPHVIPRKTKDPRGAVFHRGPSLLPLVSWSVWFGQGSPSRAV